jgi:threonine aldolase
MRFRVDLRSDTVSTPSDAMRAAMADAEVGDAWYGDDPTVNRLQERAAELTGTEAALYVATGTMANQIGLRLHISGQGHLVAAEEGAHVATTEIMTSASLAGISFRTGTDHPHGYMTAALAGRLLEPDDYFDVEVLDLLAVENTVGGAGGTILPSMDLRAVRAITDRAGVPIHMDGARIWNAAAASGEPVTSWTSQVDTMMFCLSKGLGAPIGSILCGPAELIREARRIWILYGGAWRQAGIMAAAGLIALETGRERLAEDHARARRLGEAVEALVPGSVALDRVVTNMVFVDTEAVGLRTGEVLDRLAAAGVGAVPVPQGVRMVTHVDVDDEGIGIASLFQKHYPPEIADRVPPGQRLVKTWPVLHYGPVPSFDGANWDLEVYGLVEEPVTLSFEQLRALPSTTVHADMHCVTGWSQLDNNWEGVSFRTLMEMARPTTDAKWVIAHCAHGYTSNLSLEAMADDDVLVAWRKDGEDLTPDHGWPLRLVVPKRYAWKSAKWLTGLEFAAKNVRGFWEVRGYHIHAEPFAEERYSYQEGPGAELEK